MYERFFADKYGRVTKIEQRSTPFPVHCDDACDPALHYINGQGERCLKTALVLDSLPPIVGGEVTVAVGDQVIFASIPAGASICDGPAPISEFEVAEGFSFGADTPGDHVLTIDSPLHLLLTIAVHVVPA